MGRHDGTYCLTWGVGAASISGPGCSKVLFRSFRWSLSFFPPSGEARPTKQVEAVMSDELNTEAKLILSEFLVNGANLDELPIPPQRATALLNRTSEATEEEASKLLQAYMERHGGRKPWW